MKNKETYSCENIDDTYTTKGEAELWEKYNILTKGIFGIQVVPREDNTPLIRLGREDDGTVYFDSDDKGFAAGWIDSLIELLQMASNETAEEENYTCENCKHACDTGSSYICDKRMVRIWDDMSCNDWEEW